MKVSDVFDDFAERMRADLQLARSTLSHPGAKGTAFEESVRAFLRKHFPPAFEVSTGFVVDSTGAISRQIDVIVSDANRTPVFYQAGELRVVPVEAVYAVIEVKARIDATSIADVWPNLESVKKLEKRAFYGAMGEYQVVQEAYGKTWSVPPVHYFLFAFESGDLMKIAEAIRDYSDGKRLPAWERLATVCVLDAGIITNEVGGGKIDALPQPGSGLKVTRTRRSLLLFYTLLAHYLFQASTPPFRFKDYLGQMSFGADDEQLAEPR